MVNKEGKESNPIDEKDPDGLTALHYAARFNRFKILQYLLKEDPGVCLCAYIHVCVCTHNNHYLSVHNDHIVCTE